MDQTAGRAHPWFAIDRNPHDGEEFRNPLHLVADEESVCRGQRQLRVLQACDILGRLEIEVMTPREPPRSTWPASSCRTDEGQEGLWRASEQAHARLDLHRVGVQACCILCMDIRIINTIIHE
jgi:hypothetical protein